MHLLCPASAAPLRPSSGHAQSVVVELGRYRGSRHGGVGPGAEDNAVPGFGGSGSEVPRLGSGLGVGSEAEEEAGAGSWLTPGVVKMTHRCCWLLQWMAKGCVADSKPMIEHIGGAVTML